MKNITEQTEYHTQPYSVIVQTVPMQIMALQHQENNNKQKIHHAEHLVN